MQYAVSIVIPVHNEEAIIKKQINKIIDKLKEKHIYDYEIIIVENGSTDGTLEICYALERQGKIKVISNKVADYGKALRDGMLQSKGEIIINYDIDYYDIDFLMQSMVLNPFGYDVIVASKNTRLSTDKRKFLRRLISALYKYVLYYGFGLQVSDTHGIKAWRNDDVLKYLITNTLNNYEVFDTELIIRSQYNGRKLLELPINVIETRRSVSSIVKRAIRGFVQIVKLWLYFNFKNKSS